MVFGSGLDRSPDEAVEQESYMIQLPSLCTLVLTLVLSPVKQTKKKSQLTLKQHRKYPSSNLLPSYVFIHLFIFLSSGSLRRTLSASGSTTYYLP